MAEGTQLNGCYMKMNIKSTKDLKIDMNRSGGLDSNVLNISVLFNIIKDPSTLESVQVEIGE